MCVVGAPLTGFIGERRNRRFALVTDDFRRYHELAPFFEAQGIMLLGLRTDEPVPDAVEVLLGGPADDPRSRPVHDDIESTWLSAMSGIHDPRKAVLGIDPGQKIGLALLVDDRLFVCGVVQTPDAAVERLLAWRTGLQPVSWTLHVGDGARDVGRAIRRAVRAAWPGLPISVVREHGSTPPSPQTASRHTDAAIRIAQRQP